MCLQYIIWALAAAGHAKYNQYHEVFYHRARQYIEADEMKVQVKSNPQLDKANANHRAMEKSSSPSAMRSHGLSLHFTRQR